MNIKKNFNTMTWVLIPVAIAINVVVGQIVLALKLPVFLDSIGTVLVAVLCGPWAGALTGLLSNLIWGLALDPNALPWWPVAMLIGFVAGLAGQWGLFKQAWKVVLAGLLIAVTAALASTPIAVYLYGGITASGISFLTAYLMQTGVGMVQAVFSANFIVEPVDKISTSMLAYSILQGLSARYVGRFPFPENAQAGKGNQKQELIIAIVVIVALLAFAIFGLSGVLAALAG